MPEESEIFEDLAIFPLATVLFPGAVMPLHIFEDRYKEMMRFARANGERFGLAYRSDAFIDRETPPQPGSIGCVASIQNVTPLEEGRMNVISIGTTRYRIVELTQLTPFVIARAEAFSDDPEDEQRLSDALEEIVESGKEFLNALELFDDSAANIADNLPIEPEAFSMLISSMLPVENDTKQELLEMTSTILRLTRLRSYIKSALIHLHRQSELRTRAGNNGHGRLN